MDELYSSDYKPLKMKYQSILFAGLLIFILKAESFTQKTVLEIHSKDYALAENKASASTIFLQMIKDARTKGATKITIEKGVYHLYPSKAKGMMCAITNHDNGIRYTTFPILNFENLEIDANGAEFIFHGHMLPFMIQNSKNINIKNVKIDWELPYVSEMEIINVNQDEKYIDVKIGENTPYTIKDNALRFIKENGYSHNLDEAIIWNKKHHRIAYNASKVTPLHSKKKNRLQYMDTFEHFNTPFDRMDYQVKLLQKSDRITAEELKEGIVRIKNLKRKLPSVGQILVAKGEMGSNRIAPAFWINQSETTRIENVTIHSCIGMGVLGEASKDIALNHVNIHTRRGSQRMVSTLADATHFAGCKGQIVLENCKFQHMLDDATNIHGVYMQVVDRINNYQLGVSIGHPQQLGFHFAEVGDEVGLVEPSAFHPYFKGHILEMEKVNEGYYVLTFKEELPASISDKIMVENLSAQPTFIARNCTLTDNRARGFLLSTSKGAIVENCTFSNMMTSILMVNKFDFWYESGFAENVKIENNTFLDACYGGGNVPVIWCLTSKKRRVDLITDPKIRTTKNISITNNHFKTFDAWIMGANASSDINFSHNIIEKSEEYIPLYPNHPTLEFINTENIKIEHNDFRLEKATVSVDGITEKTLSLKENRNLFVTNTDMEEKEIQTKL